MDNIILSQHIFLFPFQIKNTDPATAKNNHIIHPQGWQEKSYGLGNFAGESISNEQIWQFNEYNYFYDHVRKFLYNAQNKDCKNAARFYNWDLKNNSEFTIFIKSDEKSKEFTLKIHKIELYLHGNHIGVLSFFLNNYCYDDFESILLINDFGRRIYPQFMGAKNDENEINYNPLLAPKYSFFADRIIVKAGSVYEDQTFSEKDFLSSLSNYAKYIHAFLAPLKAANNNPEIEYIIDDRMYTICWYNSLIFESLKLYDAKKDEYGYQNSELWYKYIFVDGKFCGVGNRNMLRNLIEQTTYGRHIENGTLFALSRYSFMALTDKVDLTDGFSFSYHILRNHMQTMYYKIVLLLLVQRASILCFAQDMTKISNQIKNESKPEKEEIKENYESLKELKAKVIHFENTLWFEEITAQEQGIELYQLARKNMELEKQFDRLKEGIKDLYDYSELEIQHIQDKTMLNLTVIATFFFTVTLLVAFATFIAGLTPLFAEGQYFYTPKAISLIILVSGFVIYFMTKRAINLIIYKGDKINNADNKDKLKNSKKLNKMNISSAEIDGDKIWNIVFRSLKFSWLRYIGLLVAAIIIYFIWRGC